MVELVFKSRQSEASREGTRQRRAILQDSRPTVQPDKLADGRVAQMMGAMPLQRTQAAMGETAVNGPAIPIQLAGEGGSPVTAPIPVGASVGDDVIQAMPYRIVDGNPKEGRVEVTQSGEAIDISGSVTTKATGAQEPVSGGVLLHEYRMPPDRSQAPIPVHQHEVPDAMRVHNLNASPQRLKLGQLITYHLGLESRNRNIPYVIAMNVTAARGPFYTPLGFTDYNAQQPYQKLLEEKNSIELFLRTKSHLIQNEEQMMALVRRKCELVELMSESNMVIPTATLIDNSRAAWGQVWSFDRLEDDSRKARSMPHAYRF